MNTPMFEMLIGIPGSGKSTYASGQSKSKIHLSSDAIRKELFGDENSQEDNNRVFYIMHQRALQYLDEGKDVIYDATNITRKDRASILNALPKYVYKKAIIVWAEIDTCIERDAKRNRSVGKEVIDKMLKRFQAPYYDEGFDEIIVQRNDLARTSMERKVELFKKLDIPQDNSHHTLSLLKHLEKAKEFCNGDPPIIEKAAYFHDIGKLYTKTFTNARGEVTEEAHYYGHQGYSTWMIYGIQSLLLDHESELLVAWLISNHMEPYFNSKYYQKLPKFLKEPLDRLHEADVNAH